MFVLFAALIVPALWQRRGLPGWAAQAGTATVAAVGLAASWWLDAPSGVCVALAMALWGVASAWAGPAVSEPSHGATHLDPSGGGTCCGSAVDDRSAGTAA